MSRIIVSSGISICLYRCLSGGRDACHPQNKSGQAMEISSETSAMFADERHSGQWWAFEWATWCPSTASHHFPQKTRTLRGFHRLPNKPQIPGICFCSHVTGHSQTDDLSVRLESQSICLVNIEVFR